MGDDKLRVHVLHQIASAGQYKKEHQKDRSLHTLHHKPDIHKCEDDP